MLLLPLPVFCRTRAKTNKLSILNACLTQTRQSNQMELSQGCPIDCDTCVWVRVFHYSYIVRYIVETFLPVMKEKHTFF